RVRSHLRRYINLGNITSEVISTSSQDKLSILRSGGLELNEETKIVSLDGDDVKVTPIEYKILYLLLSNQGRVFSSHELYERVWEEDPYNCEKTVAVHIRRIRQKIEIDSKNPKYLKVVWGIGYKIENFK
ncbi:MAG: response regulator transcription factor, partial [Angelakisella sp.]